MTDWSFLLSSILPHSIILHPTMTTVTRHPLGSKYEFLTISILTKNPHVVLVSLNRPHKRNAINAHVSEVAYFVCLPFTKLLSIASFGFHS